MPNAMQPDHLKKDTLCLLVYGWKCRATFASKETQKKLDELTSVLADSGGVFVVAQSLVNADGPQDVVIGMPVVSVHANEEPKEWSLESAREAEAATATAFTDAVRAKLAPLLDEAPSGPPGWFLVPTGTLASGYCVCGELIPTPEERDITITTGCDMNQNAHDQSVRGVCIANASDWDVTEVDLSPTTCDALKAKHAGARFYVIGRYD